MKHISLGTHKAQPNPQIQTQTKSQLEIPSQTSDNDR